MQKVDLFLRKSRNNDEFARMVRGRNRSNKDAKSIIAKWRSCEHLFAKVRESEYSVLHKESKQPNKMYLKAFKQ